MWKKKWVQIVGLMKGISDKMAFLERICFCDVKKRKFEMKMRRSRKINKECSRTKKKNIEQKRIRTKKREECRRKKKETEGKIKNPKSKKPFSTPERIRKISLLFHNFS